MTGSAFREKLIAHLKSEAKIPQTITETPSGLMVMYEDEVTNLAPSLYRPVMCIILQGRKETRAGGEVMEFGAGEMLIISHTLPVFARVTEASPEAPYLALVFNIDSTVLQSLYADVIDKDFSAHNDLSLTIGKYDDKMLDALERLFDVGNNPTELKLLKPLIEKEIHYRLLVSPYGGMLRQLIRVDSHGNRVSRAIRYIHEHYGRQITMQELCDEAGMSISSFHQHFKDVTKQSPLQYIKDIRLLEARNRLMSQKISVSEAALSVGYESPSQFSRDYKRKYGSSPKSDKLGTS